MGNKALSSCGETNITDSEIYQRDIAWLRDADLVVAEVSNPSIGVGYEIGISEALNKKIICLYRGGNISAMVRGNPHITILEYDLTNLEEKITELLMNYIGSGINDGKN